MAKMWQKTMFYLGLTDDEDADGAAEPPAPSAQARVRTVEPPRSARTAVAHEQPQSTDAASTRRAGDIAGRRVEPPSRQRRAVSSNPEHAEAGVLVRPGSEESSRRPAPAPRPLQPVVPLASQCEVIEARTFSDAQVVADHIKESRPVVLDLRGTEPAMVRRLVDFATGLTYALDGRMAKIAQGVILVTGQGVSIGLEEQRRLADLGLYSVDG